MARRRNTGLLLIALICSTLPFNGALAQETKPILPGQEQAGAIFDAAMAELLKPGPKRADWDKGGADIHALVAATPGGAKENYILTIDKDGDRTVTIVEGDPAKVVPKDWEVTSRVGNTPSADVASDITLGQLVPPFYVAGIQGRRRVGDSYCSSGGMSGVLYRDRSAAAAVLPEPMVQLMFEQMFKRFQAMTICWRYDHDGDHYRSSYFLADGRSLPAFDSMSERLQIVPAGDIKRLLAEEAPKGAN